MKYITKLVSNTVSSTTEQRNQLKILTEALTSPVTSNIMRTPLQATFMSILVKSGGKPSQDKYSLFHDYYNAILKREKQKNVLKIISEHEDYISDIHYRLGHQLQLSSQRENNSSAHINISDFKVLVEKYFEEQELEKETIETYTTEIMEAITLRLVFITENQDNKIGFAIRSTQEYFSAMLNVHNLQDKIVINNIQNIATSIYWRNVFLFMLGYVAKNKEYLLDNLDSYIGELNGSGLEYNELSSSSITKYGSLISLEILAESILSSKPKNENKFIKHINKLNYVPLSENNFNLLKKLNNKKINHILLKMLIDGVSTEQYEIKMNSWVMVSELVEIDIDSF